MNAIKEGMIRQSLGLPLEKNVKVRIPFVFSKSRPHKLKNKILDRKKKHKKSLTKQF